MHARLLALATILALGAFAAQATATPVDDACTQASPSAAPCTGLTKLEGLAPSDRTAAVAAYRDSWVHRAVAFQYSLGNSVPLRDAQWLGTHNSFNTNANGVTLSHTDSNQQLTLTQQLDVDIRSLELDVHYLPSARANGSPAVVVCHGRGPDQEHFGCTTEPLLSEVLPEIRTWLDAHRDQVVLLYLEDELGDPAGYAQTVSTLDGVLGARLYRPTAATAGGCTHLPLSLTRDDVRAAGAQVVLVGNCRAGWASDVFGWDDEHVESGSTPGYRDFPACDATYAPQVYASKLVRYYEDSTFVSAAVDPTQSPADDAGNRLSAEKVAWMTRCGVNLFGLDQLLPDDGRLAASVWSWAPDQPAGRGCATQRADGRWETTGCGRHLRAACRAPDGAWRITTDAVSYADAARACTANGATFSVPRTGDDNSRVRAAAGDARVWLALRD